MALAYHQASGVAPAEIIASQDYNKLAQAFNDRLKFGVGDPGWRIIWYVHSVFRNIRNRLSDTEFPDEDEWWKLWAHLDGKYASNAGIQWPTEDPGDEAGINVDNGLMGWLYGQVLDTGDNSGVPSEPDRMNDIGISMEPISPEQPVLISAETLFPLYFYPNWLNASDDVVEDASRDTLGQTWHDTFGSPHQPITAAEKWLLGILQRGAIDPDPSTGAIEAPAYTSPRIFYSFGQPTSSPYLKAYSSYKPIPPLAGVCQSGLADIPDVPIYEIKFTNLDDDGTFTYPAKCPGQYGHVVGVLNFDQAYYVFIEDPSGNTILDRVFPYAHWVEGPYVHGSLISKQNGEQIDETLNYFALNFRGSLAQRNGEEGCYNVKAVGFDFETFLNTQYMLAPAKGIAFTAMDEDGNSVTHVREVYPRWTLQNATESPITFSTGRKFNCRYISSVVGGIDSETDTYSETVETADDRSFDPVAQPGVQTYQVSGIYVFGDNLVGDVHISVQGYNHTFNKTIPADDNGRINEVFLFNTDTNIGIQGPYSVKIGADITLNPTAYISVDALEQLIYKPGLPDYYTVIRMATCIDDAAINEIGLDTIGKFFEFAKGISNTYYASGYIPSILNETEMASSDFSPSVNMRAIYESARELFHNYTRMADRHMLTGYEVSGGKSILYFKRFVWSDDEAETIPTPIIDAITEILPSGSVPFDDFVSPKTLENGKVYVLTKTGTVAPNSDTSSQGGGRSYDEAAYAGVVYTSPNSDTITGTNTPGIDAIDIDATPAGGNTLPFQVPFATGYQKTDVTHDNGYSWKVERQLRDISNTILLPWAVVANNGPYDKTPASGYIYFDDLVIVPTPGAPGVVWGTYGQYNPSTKPNGVATVQYRFTGTPQLSTTNSTVVVYSKIQHGIENGKQYIVRSQGLPIYDGTGQQINVAVSVIYDGHAPYGLGDTFTGNTETSYQITTGKEKLYSTELSGIVNGDTYIVKGKGYVTYPVGGAHHTEAGGPFTGGVTSTYNISDAKTFLYDITEFGDSDDDGAHATAVQQGFDVFGGIAPDLTPVSLSGIQATRDYKVIATNGTLRYNGNNYSNGASFTGVDGVTSYSPNPINPPTNNTLSDARAYAISGIVSVAPKMGYSNEWQMFTTFNVYHPSSTSMWNAAENGDQIGFLNNRCHLYSPDLEDPINANLTNEFNYGQTPLVRSEAPSGYTYLEQTNNAATRGNNYWAQCGEFDSVSDCIDKENEGIRNFYRSCQIYKKDYEIESVVMNGSNEVKVTLTTRLQSLITTPIPIERVTATYATSEPLRAELYRTDENAIREYIRCVASNCEDLTASNAIQCSRFKIGDYAPGAQIPFLADSPFGACFPRFYFVKKVPKVFEDSPPNTTSEPTRDTRREVDPFVQMEFYLRAMCGGFIDVEATKQMNCDNTDGTSRMIDFTFENLMYQATRQAEGTALICGTDFSSTPIYETRNSADVLAQVTVDTHTTISWSSTQTVTGSGYSIQRSDLGDPTMSGTLTYGPWEEIAQVGNRVIGQPAASLYTDIVSVGPAYTPVVNQSKYRVFNRVTNALDGTSATSVTHYVGWNVTEQDVYEVYRSENDSVTVASPNWDDYSRVGDDLGGGACSGLYDYPAYQDTYDLNAHSMTQIRYKVRLIRGFTVQWHSIVDSNYLLTRNTLYADGTSASENIGIITAVANPTNYIDIPTLSTINTLDMLDSQNYAFDVVPGATTTISITPTDVVGLVVTPQTPDDNGNYKIDLSWTAPGPTVYVLRRYKYANSISDWSVVSHTTDSSYNDQSVWNDAINSDIEYKVQYTSQVPPTLTWTPDANSFYKVTRITTSINGDSVSQDLSLGCHPLTTTVCHNPSSCPDGCMDALTLYAPDTSPMSFFDTATYTPLLVSVSYTAYKFTGFVITWRQVEGENPDTSYDIVRTISFPAAVDTIASFNASTNYHGYTYTDLYTLFNSQDITYRVEVRFTKPIRSISYNILKLSAGRNRWLSNMPLSLRPDRPEGFGPLPSTCMRSTIFNNYAASINLLTDARVDLPFDFQMQTIDSGKEYSVNLSCLSPGDGVNSSTGEDFGTCTGSPTFSSGSFNTNAIVFNFPADYGAETLGAWEENNGDIIAQRSAGFILDRWFCKDGVKVLGGISTSQKQAMRVLPNDFAKEAMSKELQDVVNNRGLGFFGLETTSINSFTLEPVATEAETEVCRNIVEGTVQGVMKCDNQYYTSVLAAGDVVTNVCRFYSGNGPITVEAPPLPIFDHGLFRIPDNQAAGCGGGETTRSISIPDHTQFVASVSIPTIP